MTGIVGEEEADLRREEEEEDAETETEEMSELVDENATTIEGGIVDETIQEEELEEVVTEEGATDQRFRATGRRIGCQRLISHSITSLNHVEIIPANELSPLDTRDDRQKLFFVRFEVLRLFC